LSHNKIDGGGFQSELPGWIAGVEVPDFALFSGHGGLTGVQGRNSFHLRPRPACPEVPAARTIKNQKQHTVHQLSG